MSGFAVVVEEFETIIEDLRESEKSFRLGLAQSARLSTTSKRPDRDFKKIR
jgi:hypothetical protein